MRMASLSVAAVYGGGGTGSRGGLILTSVPAISQRFFMVADGVWSPSSSRFLLFSKSPCRHPLLVLHGNHRLSSRRLVCGMSNSDNAAYLLFFVSSSYGDSKVNNIKSLYLNHAWPQWYQFITATFCHADWNHLSSNLFFLYIFGKLVEEDEGSFALWISYLLTGAGANLVSWIVLPRNAVSIGASGAVFGLFAISVLVKMRLDWRKILEVLILGQFVLKKVMEEAQASARLPGTVFGGYSLYNINHIAHLSGALIGVILIWLLSGIPVRPSTKDTHRREDEHKMISVHQRP